jgi:CRISPR/Cas system-associated endonuclease Cas3-HD
VVQQVIVAQEEKERKMMSKVKDLLEQSHRNLQDRIRKRSEIKELRSSLLSTTLMGQTGGTLNSTCSRGSSGWMRGDRVEANSSFEL